MNGKAKRVEYLVMKFINERRVERGLDRLDTDNALRSAAREHSRDMARRGYVAHQSEHYGGPVDRVKNYDRVAENIHMEEKLWGNSPIDIAGQSVKSWMQSAGHRENILRNSNRIQGVGVWKSGQTVYLTHLFSPERPAKAPEPSLNKIRQKVPTLGIF